MNWGSAPRAAAAAAVTLAVVATAGCSGAAAPANVDERTAASATGTMVATINDLTAAVGTGWKLPGGDPATSITATDLDEGECQGKTALGTNDQDPKGFYDEANLQTDNASITTAVKERIRAVFRSHHLTDIIEAADSKTTTSITATGAAGTTPKLQVIYPTTGTGPVTIRGFSLCRKG